MVIGKHEAVNADKLGGNGEGKAQLYHWLDGAEMCPNLEPVSYTHLDVYKRQEIKLSITTGTL